MTWLPTRMPSSHLDTDMAFLSDKSIVYTFTLGAALITKSAVPLPKGGAPWTCGVTSTLNPSPVFSNWLPTSSSVLHLQAYQLIGFLIVSLLVAACPFYLTLPTSHWQTLCKAVVHTRIYQILIMTTVGTVFAVRTNLILHGRAVSIWM